MSCWLSTRKLVRLEADRLHIVSSCKPQMAKSILTEDGMSEALEHKLLISILAGTTIGQLVSWVPASTRVVRAMPNTPCKVRFSCRVPLPDFRLLILLHM